jgi:hypothetical protein
MKKRKKSIKNNLKKGLKEVMKLSEIGRFDTSEIYLVTILFGLRSDSEFLDRELPEEYLNITLLQQ